MFYATEKRYFPGELGEALLKITIPDATTLRGEPARKDDAIQSIGMQLRKLWPLLAKDRGQATEDPHYSFSGGFVDAYAAYYMPANCLKLPAILLEAEALSMPFLRKGFTWLDIGCGPGTGAVGLFWYLLADAHIQKNGANVEPALEGRYIGLDQSQGFLSKASSILAQLQSEFGFKNLRADFQHAPADRKGTLFKQLKADKPTVLSFINSIAEWESDPRRRIKSVQKIIRTMQEQCDSDNQVRHILIVEPGSKDSSRELLDLRKQIAEQVSIELPCFDARACGALKSREDWCHEEVALSFPEWHDVLGAHADMRKSSLIFSYLLLKIEPQGAKSNLVPENAPAKNTLRIVSQRLEHKGYQECFFCTQDKGKVRARKQKGRTESAAIPELARGKLFTKLVQSEKGDLLDLGQDYSSQLSPEQKQRLEFLFPS